MTKVMLALAVLLGATLGLGQVKKVAGDYYLTKIESTAAGDFRVSFTATQITGKFDRLELLSDHIHFGIKQGDIVRLAGQVARLRKDGTAELSQVMVFLPSREGPTPVWMLSKRFRSRGLEGARYLEMHAPSADYLVF